MTRLNSIHPYPAMLHEQVLLRLASQYIVPGTRVLDPFCGTGRCVVAAAERGAVGVGVDVNPLACLIAEAKTCRVRAQFISKLAKSFNLRARPKLLDLELERKVEWYPAAARIGLSRIIEWINGLRIWRSERLFLAAVLSATVRDVSFCRKDQWKLHRMSDVERRNFSKCPWEVFSTRLNLCLQELTQLAPPLGRCEIFCGDSRKITQIVGKEKYDLIFSSPPYGDSRTTVQYGAVSSLCLAAVSHVRGLGVDYSTGGAIDGAALGGKVGEPYAGLGRYWRGSPKSEGARRISSFFSDLRMAILQSCLLLRNGGRAVFVVGNRRVDGMVLRLDKFVCDCFAEGGLPHAERGVRTVRQKWTPFRVNSQGASKVAKPVSTSTMALEYTLVFSRG